MAQKANTARLKKLHTRAKSIIRKHPGKKYASALKEAGKEMRTGKIRSPKKRTMPVKRKAAARHKARHRPRKRIGESGVSTNITVGAVNKHKKIAREKLLHLIGKEETKKFTAKLKRVKKKIGKKIIKLKSEYRRLA